MLNVLGAFVLSGIGVFLIGLLHLSLAEITVVLAVPVMFLYKLFGNRPSFFVLGGVAGGIAGSLAAFWAYVVVPIQYYYDIWGWPGVVGGIVAVILVPAQLILFLAVAIIKGGALVHIFKFFGGICLGSAGILLFNSGFSTPMWSVFFKRKSNGAV